MLIFSGFTYAQIGTPDLTFNPADNAVFGDQTGANQTVNVVKLQSDGKILIGGEFTAYNGQGVNYIARLNADGSLDQSFTVGNGFNNWVSDMVILASGKIVVVGNFTSYNGTAANRVVMLNTDGTIATTFNIGSGANGVLRSVEISQSGQLYLGGDFSDFNGSNVNDIVRVNVDGSVDNTFYAPFNFGSFLLGIKEQSNGGLIAYGIFDNYGGNSLNSVVRLQNNGTLDVSFNTGIDVSQSVSIVFEDASGQLYVGGNYTSIIGYPNLEKLVRYSAAGVIDPTFDLSPNLSSNSAVKGVVAIGGELFLSGTGFSLQKRNLTGGIINNQGTGPTQLYGMDYDGVNFFVSGTNGVFKIALPNVDEDFFNVGNGINGIGRKAKVLPNGKILVCGSIDTYNSTPVGKNTVVRLMPDGTLDPTFALDMNPLGLYTNSIHDFVVQPDGKIITDAAMNIGGTSRGIVRLFSDGNIDSSFLIDPTINISLGFEYAHQFFLQPDGKLVFAVTSGSGNNAINNIYRVNSDGSLDASFNSWLTLSGTGRCRKIIGVPDGRLYTGTDSGDMYSLMPDGSENIEFSNATFICQALRDIVVDPYGNLIVAGQFWPFTSSIVRIDPDSNFIDPNFDTQWNGTEPIESMLFQPDGKLLVMKVDNVGTGQFQTVVRRFNIDGSVDNHLFTSPYESTTSIMPVHLTTDATNQIILVGGFNNTNTAFVKNGITRILNDTIIDPCQFLQVGITVDTNLTCNQNGVLTANPYFGVAPYDIVWNTSTPLPSINVNSGGINFVTVTDANGCAVSAGTYVPGPSITGNNFDLKTNLLTTSFRPGFTSNIWLDAFNDGCALTSGQLQLILDTTVTFISANPAATINGDTLVWDFTNIAYDSAHITPFIIVNVPVTAQIGDTVCFEAHVLPISGDADTTNNRKKYCFPIINGYDPNDKKVWPIGKCEDNYITEDQVLTYKIRFQNTGNASAINVRVEDSLDTNLDLNTFRIVGSSHSVYSDIQSNGVINFLFGGINLIDSMTNEPESHGYVIFEIQPLAQLGHGTVITNKVGIFFDFNPPIITNTVMNTIFDGDLDNLNCEELGINFNELVETIAYPNPFDQQIVITGSPAHTKVEIFNTVGGLVVTGETDASGFWSMDTSELQNGLYLIKLRSENSQRTIRAIKI